MIKFDQITSDLTYLGNSIKNISLTNSTICLSENAEKSFGMDIEIGEITTTNERHIGKILLKLQVVILENNDENMKLDMLIEGYFSSSATITKNDFKNQIAINGAAALYSIARTKVEIISAMTFLSGKVTLPMVNIIEY
ncbi:MAG: hypothetical protein RR064_05645, partial [Oscillospiraceae bacterium]